MKKVKSILNQIKINDQTQYYTIQSQDISKPLMLFLHGGPGGANIGMSSVLESKSQLTNHFSIIQYDQRGAGKSYNKMLSKENMSLDILLDDVLKLIDHLLEKYHQQKLFLVGHSFGTLLGMRVCHAVPSKIEAYIGVSQLVNMFVSEKICIQESLKLSDEKNNMKAKEMIEKSIKHFENKRYPEYIMDQRLAMTKIGGYTYNRKPMQPSIMYIISALSPHYSIKDAILMKEGLMNSTKLLWNEVLEVNLSKEITELKVPIYFIQGVSDIVASPDVAKEYFELLKAPKKEFLLFTKSGHSPQGEEVEKYEKEVIRLLLDKEV